MAFSISPGHRLGRTKDPGSAHIKPPWIMSHPGGTGQWSCLWKQMTSGQCGGLVLRTWHAAAANRLLARVWDPLLALLVCAGRVFLSPISNQRAPQDRCLTHVSRRWEEAQRNPGQAVASAYSADWGDNPQYQKPLQVRGRGFLCPRWSRFEIPLHHKSFQDLADKSLKSCPFPVLSILKMGHVLTNCYTGRWVCPALGVFTLPPEGQNWSAAACALNLGFQFYMIEINEKNNNILWHVEIICNSNFSAYKKVLLEYAAYSMANKP